MSRSSSPIRVGDMTLLGGWLFADLLLALMVIFFAAIPGATQGPPKILPVLTLNTLQLNQQSSTCQGDAQSLVYTCKVQLSGTPGSQSPQLTWNASTDMENVKLSPPTGNITKGAASTPVTISGIPCHNGSFTFQGSQNAYPVVVKWQCKAPIVLQKLDFTPQRIELTINDVNAFLTSNKLDNDIKNQLNSDSKVKGRHVGLVIAYGGAPTDADIQKGQQIAEKVYKIVQSMNKDTTSPYQNAATYVDLYTLQGDPQKADIDVYLFAQS